MKPLLIASLLLSSSLASVPVAARAGRHWVADPSPDGGARKKKKKKDGESGEEDCRVATARLSRAVTSS